MQVLRYNFKIDLKNTDKPSELIVIHRNVKVLHFMKEKCANTLDNNFFTDCEHFNGLCLMLCYIKLCIYFLVACWYKMNSLACITSNLLY